MKRGAIVILCVVIAPTSMAAPPPTEDVGATVQRLRREVDALSAERDASARRRDAERRALAADIIRDASARTSLADREFTLQIGAQIQFRWTLSAADTSDGEDGTRAGFELRRTKLSFSGRVFDRDWRYRVQMSIGADTGRAELQSAWLRRRLGDGWSVRGGQFKLPLLREEDVSSRRQLLVERSLVDREFRPGFSQGVEAVWRGEQFRVSGAFSDGLRGSNTPVLERDTEYAFTGRVEWQSGDDWSRFSDFTSPPGSDAAILLGAAAHVQSDEFGTDRTEDRLFRWTADASLELDGANLFGAVIGDRVEPQSGPHETRIGFVVHGGAYVHDDVEVFARYEYGDAGGDTDDLSLLTGGFNWYRDEHRLKATADVGYAFNAVDRVWASRGAGWRRDRDGQDGQIVARLQLQLLF